MKYNYIYIYIHNYLNYNYHYLHLLNNLARDRSLHDVVRLCVLRHGMFRSSDVGGELRIYGPRRLNPTRELSQHPSAMMAEGSHLIGIVNINALGDHDLVRCSR